MMANYKQSVKDKSRNQIWQHAIESLTTRRGEVRMLNYGYLSKLTDYVENKAERIITPLNLANYYRFLDITYGQKSAEQLKVAFFCGPEPENDVEVLLKLGVRLENMYAFELGKAEFNQAVIALRGKYPQLKIYNGRIEEFALMHNTIFDIVYLFSISIMNCYYSLTVFRYLPSFF